LYSSAGGWRFSLCEDVRGFEPHPNGLHLFVQKQTSSRRQRGTDSFPPQGSRIPTIKRERDYQRHQLGSLGSLTIPTYNDDHHNGQNNDSNNWNDDDYRANAILRVSLQQLMRAFLFPVGLVSLIHLMSASLSQVVSGSWALMAEAMLFHEV
jgi:hypothetical protein